MKKHILYLILILSALSSCKEMDSEYKDFIVPNGYTYPQRADSLKIYPGFNKLRLVWRTPKSPTVKYAMVHWNNYNDSLKVEWKDNQDSIIVDIPKLSETSYTFFIKNYDEFGNISLPVDGTGTPYGDNYLLGATDRTYILATRDSDKKGTITWGPKTTDLVYTEVRYTTSSGTKKTVRVDFDQDKMTYPDIKPGELFEYRSVFLPRNGIDSIARDWQTSEKPFMYKFPTTKWVATARNGNHPWGDGGGGQPALLFDGNKATGWHSSVGAPLPQVVVTDFNESLELDNIIIYPPAQTNWRYIKNVDIYLSDTPLPADAPSPSWGKPIASATYTGQEAFTIKFDSVKKGRYLAIVFLDSSSGNTYVSFMELEAYGY